MDSAHSTRDARGHGLAAACLGWLAGNALQLQQAQLWPLWRDQALVLAAAAVIAWLLLRPASKGLRFGLLVLAFGMLALGLTGWRAHAFAARALDATLEGRDIAVTGTVVAMPQRFEGGLRFRFDVDSARLAGQEVRLPRRLELAWYGGALARAEAADEPLAELQGGPASLQAGERWQFTLRLKAPHGGLNPHGFDYELWQWERGVQAAGYVRSGRADPPPVRLGQSGRHPVEWARGQVRDRILAQLAGSPAAGLVAALVVGDQAAIERADWDAFRATGVAHLMSISGLHITMFAWLAALWVGWCWRRSTWLCLRLPASSAALLGGIALALAYALFSGWGIPAQRTVLMLACVGGLRLLGLRWPWPLVWLLACAVVVAADPWAWLQAGFWLSFVAVGVLFASDAGAGRHAGQGLRARLWGLLREQWVITVVLSPLSLLLFGQVSLVGLLANALAIPWVTLLVTPLAMAGVLWPALWQLAGQALAGLTWVLHGLAQFPWASLSVAQAPWWAGLAGVLGGLLWVLRLPWPLRLAGLPLLLPVLCWQVPAPAPGEFELLAPDVGQGSAVLVRTANHALLYDAGPRYSRESDAGHRVLVPLLRALAVRLDLLVLSHRDSDHIGGAAAVLLSQPQAQVLASFDALSEETPGRALTRCQAGQRWQWDGVDFEVLHPLAGDAAGSRQSNALSCVLRIANGARSIWLVGDIEQAQEAQLVARWRTSGQGRGATAPADLLLAPHHGSKTSSSEALLQALQPRLALVQAGYRNRFGHPADPVLLRYHAQAIQVVNTTRCGAASWQSWRADQVQCARVQRRRYWQHQPP